jgi:hypothetical protein
MNKIVVLAVSLSAVLSMCSGAQASSLVGTWKSSEPEMIAHISRHKIAIDFAGDGSSALYWRGTVPSSISNGGKFVSKGNIKAMDASLLGSTSKTKRFTYKNGRLSFKFSILGITRTVYLRKK